MIPLNKGDFYETHAAYQLALIHSNCSQTDNFSLKLPTQTHQRHFTRFRYHCVKQCFSTFSRSYPNIKGK